MSDKPCGCSLDGTCVCDTHKRIAELQTELASYMESDANLRKRVEELEAKLGDEECET